MLVGPLMIACTLHGKSSHVEFIWCITQNSPCDVRFTISLYPLIKRFISNNPLDKIIFSSLLVFKFVCLPFSNMTGKRMDGFSWNHNNENLRAECLTLGHRVSFYFIFFLGNPCLWAASQKTGWTVFHDFVRKARTCDEERSGTFSISVNPLNPDRFIYLLVC